ncbi:MULTISPECIES: H-NS histone family protein [Roseomonadaceae]|uniref:H-NS histone family protein n=1 Tax=Falsiroseomonas oleicola TaxID=2801474 RepID=A0ABS6H2K6_9PROT|nr:H-NS histone family protein [Roseomonas oleicola]MBU8542904.1 H-NS histone family protein [Roseomonas oleicola]
MTRESKMSVSDVISALENLSVAEIIQVIAAAEEQRDGRMESEKKELMEEFRAKAEAMGLSFDELVGTPPRRQATPSRGAKKAGKSSVEAKYRNPETGTTWSGRGRMPIWLKVAEAEGKSRENFAIKS